MPSWLEQVGRFALFSLRVLADVPFLLIQPRTTVAQFGRFIIGTLPIVVIIGISLGLVSWMHVGSILQRFDSEQLLPTLLMVAVVLEFGPVSVGLIAASRLAAGLAAEIAAMKATEQIDAVRVLGVDPYVRIFAPRVLACVLVLPPLTVAIDYAALVGSYAAEWLGGGLSWELYYQYALDQSYLGEAILATFKTTVFGLLVGLVSCWYGMHAESSTEAVGLASTRAVVGSMLCVLISNVFLVRAIQLLAPLLGSRP